MRSVGCTGDRFPQAYGGVAENAARVRAEVCRGVQRRLRVILAPAAVRGAKPTPESRRHSRRLWRSPGASSGDLEMRRFGVRSGCHQHAFSIFQVPVARKRNEAASTGGAANRENAQRGDGDSKNVARATVPIWNTPAYRTAFYASPRDLGVARGSYEHSSGQRKRETLGCCCKIYQPLIDLHSNSK